VISSKFYFNFDVRKEGDSKLTGKVMLRYLDQLLGLYIYKFGLSTVLGLFFFSLLMMYLFLASVF
jgi:dolichol-phosphate mannosyltransferase